MLSNVPRTVTSTNAAKGFFSLFFEWSVANGRVAGSQIHSNCAPRCRTNGQQQRSFHNQKPLQHVKRDDGNGEPRLSTQLRELMRKMPHSVVVATTSTAGSSETAAFRGMTVSSFTTLTLTPSPIITFNIRKPSRTLDAIKESKQFLIHILSATDAGAQVAHNFTQGNSGDVFAGQKFAVWNCGSACPLPLLASPGVMKVLRCKLREAASGEGLVEVGDHVLVLADVESFIEPPPTKERAGPEDRGLSYLDRAYREMGAVIDVSDPKEDEQLAD